MVCFQLRHKEKFIPPVKLAMDKAALEQLDGAYPMKDNSMVILKAIMSYLEYIRSEVWKM